MQSQALALKFPHVTLILMDNEQQSPQGGNVKTNKTTVEYSASNIKRVDSKQYFTSTKESPKESIKQFFVRLGDTPVFRGKRKFFIFGGLASAVVLIALIFLISFVVAELTRPQVLTVGDTTITKQDIADYSKAIQQYLDDNPNSTFGDDSPQRIAETDLILNAILKWYATPEKCNIAVTAADILDINGIDITGIAETDFFLNLRLGEPSATNFLRTRAENIAYQSKLFSCMIATKELFQVIVTFGSPFFTQNPDNMAESLAIVKARLTDEFLPLFEQGLSKEEIARHANIDYINSEANFQDQQDASGSNFPFNIFALTTVVNRPDFFNDSSPETKFPDYFGEVLPMNAVAATLTEIGQHTGVLVTSNGEISISRLESTSGQHISWGSIVQEVRDQNKSFFQWLGNVFASVVDGLVSLLPAETATAANMCQQAESNDGQKITWYTVHFANSFTNVDISGVKFELSLKFTPPPGLYGGTECSHSVNPISTTNGQMKVPYNCLSEMTHGTLTLPPNYIWTQPPGYYVDVWARDRNGLEQIVIQWYNFQKVSDDPFVVSFKINSIVPTRETINGIKDITLLSRPTKLEITEKSENTFWGQTQVSIGADRRGFTVANQALGDRISYGETPVEVISISGPDDPKRKVQVNFEHFIALETAYWKSISVAAVDSQPYVRLAALPGSLSLPNCGFQPNNPCTGYGFGRYRDEGITATGSLPIPSKLDARTIRDDGKPRPDRPSMYVYQFTPFAEDYLLPARSGTYKICQFVQYDTSGLSVNKKSGSTGDVSFSVLEGALGNGNFHSTACARFQVVTPDNPCPPTDPNYPHCTPTTFTPTSGENTGLTEVRRNGDAWRTGTIYAKPTDDIQFRHTITKGVYIPTGHMQSDAGTAPLRTYPATNDNCTISYVFHQSSRSSGSKSCSGQQLPPYPPNTPFWMMDSYMPSGYNSPNNISNTIRLQVNPQKDVGSTFEQYFTASPKKIINNDAHKHADGELLMCPLWIKVYVSVARWVYIPHWGTYGDEYEEILVEETPVGVSSHYFSYEDEPTLLGERCLRTHTHGGQKYEMYDPPKYAPPTSWIGGAYDPYQKSTDPATQFTAAADLWQGKLSVDNWQLKSTYKKFAISNVPYKHEKIVYDAFKIVDAGPLAPEHAYVRIPYNYTLDPSVTVDQSSVIFGGSDINVNAKIELNTRSNPEASSSAYATISKPTIYKVAAFVAPASVTFEQLPKESTKGTPTTGSGGGCSYYNNFVGRLHDGCKDIKTNGDTSIRLNSDGNLNGGLPLQFSEKIAIPDMEAGSKFCVGISVWPSDSHNYTSGPVGTNEIALNPTGLGVWTHTAPVCRTIAKKPSVHFYSAGVYTTGPITTSQSTKAVGYGPGAALTPTSSINSGNRRVFGSWTEYEAIAKGDISGFGSGAAFGFNRNNSGDYTTVTSSNTSDYFSVNANPGSNSEPRPCIYSTQTFNNDACSGKAMGKSNINAMGPTILSRIIARYTESNPTIPSPTSRCVAFDKDDPACDSASKSNIRIVSQIEEKDASGTVIATHPTTTYVRMNGTGTEASIPVGAKYCLNRGGTAGAFSQLVVIEIDGILRINENIYYGQNKNQVYSGANRNAVSGTNRPAVGPGNSGCLEGVYSSISQLPQMIIIADEIRVSPEVTNIDAWLIAGRGNKVGQGTINTCAGYSYNSLTASVCNQTLTINGPVFAGKLLLNRTAGAGSDLASPGNQATQSIKPAEIFNLRADTFLWSYAQAQRFSQANMVYSREMAPRY